MIDLIAGFPDVLKKKTQQKLGYQQSHVISLKSIFYKPYSY